MTAPVRSITLPVTELVLRVARASVGAAEQGSANDGPFVRRVQRRTGNKPPDPWCSSFTSDIGALALGTQWPCPLSARVQVVANWAVRAKCRYIARATPAMVGDMFVLWYPKLKRYAHIGFVQEVQANGYTVRTIEGNTSNPSNTDPALQREGWLVAERTRVLDHTARLIRWWQVVQGPLDPFADPTLTSLR